MPEVIEINKITGQPVGKKIDQSNIKKCPECGATLTGYKNELVCMSCKKYKEPRK